METLTWARASQNDRMIDIADVPFSSVPEDEQARFVSKTRELGEWQGYKPRQFWVRCLDACVYVSTLKANPISARTDLVCRQWRVRSNTPLHGYAQRWAMLRGCTKLTTSLLVTSGPSDLRAATPHGSATFPPGNPRFHGAQSFQRASPYSEVSIDVLGDVDATHLNIGCLPLGSSCQKRRSSNGIASKQRA